MTLVAALAVFLGSVSQAVTGFGFSLVCAPFLVAAYDAPAGVQLNIVLSVLLNIALVGTGRHHVDWGAVVRLLLPAAVATVIVGRIVQHASVSAVTVAAGTICLLGVVAVARNKRAASPVGPVGTAAVGALSGAINVAAGIGGPPVVLFSVNAGWAPRVARSTLQAFFLGINLVAIVTLGLPDHVPAGVIIAMVAGLPVGHAMAQRLEPHHIRGIVLLIAAGGSLLAIGRGLFA